MVVQILETVVMARAIKLSDALISDAAVSGKAQHRSTPRQIVLGQDWQNRRRKSRYAAGTG